MRRIIALFLLLVCFLPGRAQTIASQADSLLKRLSITSGYDEKIELLGNISDVYSYTDSVKSIYYATQIKKLAEQKQDQYGIGFAYYRLGGAYLEAVDLDNAHKAYQRAAEILSTDSNAKAQAVLARVLSNRGLVYQRQGNSDIQLKIMLEKVIPINLRLNDSVKLGKNYYAIGTIFQNIKDHKKAIDYFQRSENMLRNTPSIPELTDAYISMVVSMIYLNIPDNQRDSVFSLLRKSDHLMQLYPDAISKVKYLQTLGMAWEYFDGDTNKADHVYEQAIELAEKNNLATIKSSLLLRQYYIKVKTGKYKEALAITQELYEQYAIYMSPDDRLLHLRHLMEMEEKLGNTKAALAWQKAYIILNDSLQTANTQVKIQELEQRYTAKEKENQIVKLNQVAQAQQLQIQKSRFWLYLLSVLALFLAGFFVARQIISRNKHKIAVQEAELLQQRIDTLKKEQQLSQYDAVLEGQEQERKRLAIDLHDGLGGALSGIRLKLSKLIRDEALSTPVEGKTTALMLLAEEMDRSINELRHIARNLMPEALLKYGLVAAIKDFCKSMETDTVQINFQSFDVRDDLPKTTQIMVYRILQELITNAVKHAEAKHILAQCLQREDIFSITVEDDGKGFAVDDRTEGIGLSTLRSRVNFLGGQLDLQSEPGVGTSTNIEFNVNHEQ
ncbi:MAG: sensor histidine kinase [Bacteroidetes bacterium]|nr:sensor histidine kinase [Bacteroidota bacterium]